VPMGCKKVARIKFVKLMQLEFLLVNSLSACGSRDAFLLWTYVNTSLPPQGNVDVTCSVK